MTLILSSEEDLSTNDVIDWLLYYKHPFLRISKKDTIKFKSIFISNEDFEIYFSINKKNYKISDFNNFWYRRSEYDFFIEQFPIDNLDNEMNRSIQNFIYLENLELQKLLKSYISTRSLNKFEDIFLNKLEVLKLATKAGLSIPKTLITNYKDHLISFKEKNIKLITKNISPGIFIENGKYMLRTLVKEVENKDIKNLPNIFCSMMFQAQIKKLFELRIFYINDHFYSSAILSQNDERTRVDFRNYNFDKPNRTPPFKLPEYIELKLKKLIKMIGINSGSIDMIISTDEEYIFLELNPIGQFAQVSNPCNFYLEKIIANELVNGY